jgi:hypothetical protein
MTAVDANLTAADLIRQAALREIPLECSNFLSEKRPGEERTTCYRIYPVSSVRINLFFETLVDLDETSSKRLSKLLMFYAQSIPHQKWTEARQNAIYAFWIAHFADLVDRIESKPMVHAAA